MVLIVRVLSDFYNLPLTTLDYLVDWEHPLNEQEGRDFVALLEICRYHLADAAKYTLTAALPAAEWALRNIDIQKASANLSFLNIMCYDFFGPWSDAAGYHAQLFAPSHPSTGTICAATAFSYLHGQGVPPSKLTLGIPLYGRVFKNATSIGQAVGDKQERVSRYRDLPPPGHVEHVDYEAVAAYCVDGDGSLVTYDNAMTVEMKAQFVYEKGLRGIFFWEATGDKTGQDSLTLVSSKVFRALSACP